MKNISIDLETYSDVDLQKCENISFLILPNTPSQAELSGEQPFFDIDRMKPFFSILSIQPGQR